MKNLDDFSAYAEDAPTFTPEERLALAVLERAYRDLMCHGERDWQRRAQQWFLDYFEQRPTLYYLSCRNVFIICNLTTTQIEILKELVYADENKMPKETKTWPDVQKERQDRRIGMGEFSEGERTKRKAYCPMQRKVRAFTC